MSLSQKHREFLERWSKESPPEGRQPPTFPDAGTEWLVKFILMLLLNLKPEKQEAQVPNSKRLNGIQKAAIDAMATVLVRAGCLELGLTATEFSGAVLRLSAALSDAAIPIVGLAAPEFGLQAPADTQNNTR